MSSDQWPAAPVDATDTAHTPGAADTAATAASDDPSARQLGRLAATVARLREEVEQAHAAADGRALVEMARGVLVERLRFGPTQAAKHLAELARAADVTELELAADIVSHAAQDRLTDAARDFLDRVAHATPADTAEPPPVGGADATVRLRTAESGVLAAGDTQTVAESLLEHALKPLDATAVAVWAAGPGTSLRLAGHAGFRPDEADQWHYVPPGVATPARQALLTRRSMWYPAWTESELPSIGGRGGPHGSRMAVPASTEGRIQGVLEVAWPRRQPPLSPQIRRQIEALAELVGHTLESLPHTAAQWPQAGAGTLNELIALADGLRDPVLLLRPHFGPDGTLTDFRIHHVNPRFNDPAGRSAAAVTGALLLEAYPMVAGEGGLLEMIEHVHATGEPFRATAMDFTALVGQVPVTGPVDISISRHGDAVLFVWRVEDEAARLARLLQHAQRLGRIGAFEENFLTNEVTWNSQLFDLFGLPDDAAPTRLEQVATHAHGDDAAPLGRFLRTVLHHRRPATAAFRLLRPDGVIRHMRIVAEPVLDGAGHLGGVRGAYQDISAQHWTEVALAATRDQLALSEQQTAESNRLARQLQHAIMPPTHGPIDAPGLEIAVRYRPAEDDSLVGGDWYDAIVLPSQQVLLSVGDVAGHGISAATGMVALRNALRGLATTGAGPAQLLTWLNLVAHHLTQRVTATAICALYDPETHILRWARAGHLPPLLIRAGEPTTVPSPDGLLLGAVSEAVYEEGQVRLEHGDVLLMYTDGLIERRDRSLQESLDQLLATVRRPAQALDQRLDQMLTHSSADTDDDTCVIGIHLRTPAA
ncbi:SpoIIE family protein phosphatase [Streptomyces sp. ICBB 8177]|uniref:SpoIIE family protein phosphatase n=1 Tax=Streptomyces sp. ICBB 8177 TaxID=563922 RepID=UPI000D683929|nr:SpoIIE family protein phosphatase [Streptomyces sp. ICBB 8177]PWI42987.1 antitermination regulator [Streptomyces sp. ICBB 8177]